MKKPDVILVAGLELTKQKIVLHQYGQSILKQILEKRYAVEQVNFDRMVSLGEFRYEGDYDDDLERMADLLAARGAGIIGFYTICNNFINVAALVQRVHQKAPEAKLFFGGPHATMTWEHCLKAFPFLSAVCMGESEHSILPLVDALTGGGDLAAVPGIGYRGADGSLVRNAPCALIPQEALSDYVVYDRDYMPDPEHGTMFIEGGRGCPFHCSFCSTSRFWLRHFRVKPVDDLIREMDNHHEKLGFKRFSVEHDMFTANKKHLHRFCNILIDRGAPYRWACSSRIDVLDEESIRLMAASGCDEVFLGIETGSPRMQKRIDKHLNLEDSIPKIILMQQLGINVKCSFIYGLVDETEEDFLMTLDMLKKLYLAGVRFLQLHRFFPLPSTPDGEAIRDGIYFDEYDIDLSIISRKALTPQNRALILEYPDLFLHLYSFKNDVRRKYRWADSLAAFTSDLSVYFPHTCAVLLDKLDYQTLYLRYEEMFRRLSLAFSTDGDQAMHALVHPMLRRIVETEDYPPLTEMHRYETDVMDYVENRETEMRIVSYNMDVLRAKEKREYDMKSFRAVLALNKADNTVRTIAVPAWVSFD